jgi:3',5'-cyclic AMP phosphodiesterase CpdA
VRVALTATAVLLLAGCNLNEQGFLSASKTGDMTYAPAPRKAFDDSLVAACGRDAYASGAEDRLERRPYLQRVGSRSAQLMWTSSAPVGFEVRVTTPAGELVALADGLVDESAVVPDAEQYVADLAVLEPDRIYCYELVADGDVWLGRTAFRTAPTTGDDARVSFVALGDLGARQPDQFAVREQLLTVEADFAIVAGDVAYESGTLAEFEANYFDVYHRWIRHLPVFPASGNHDYRCEDAAPFRAVFSLPTNGGPDGYERWYSYEWGPVHIVVLDTERLGPSQTEWLEADLAGNDQPWTVVVAHRPPYSSGRHGSHYPTRDAFGSLFERHGVQLVLGGHDHHYERMWAQGGVTYIVTGAGGRGTREVGRSDFTAFVERVSHFTYVVIDGDVLTLYAIDAMGAVFDTVRVGRTPPGNGGGL